MLLFLQVALYDPGRASNLEYKRAVVRARQRSHCEDDGGRCEEGVEGEGVHAGRKQRDRPITANNAVLKGRFASAALAASYAVTSVTVSDAATSSSNASVSTIQKL